MLLDSVIIYNSICLTDFILWLYKAWRTDEMEEENEDKTPAGRAEESDVNSVTPPVTNIKGNLKV